MDRRAAPPDPELLDQMRITGVLGEAADRLTGLECVGETVSTNADLLERPGFEAHGVARFAECQTGGRGRRGRSWFSPYARNVYLSLGWRFDAGPAALRFLPLMVAVSAARSVSALGLHDHLIKWPNDLVTPRGKLGGCLVEVRGAARGPSLAVLGVGLNVRLAGAPGIEAMDPPPADLATALPEVSRNAAAGQLLRALLDGLELFEAGGLGAEGFAPFVPDWERYDCLLGQEVQVRGEQDVVHGTCHGLGPEGGLLVETNGQLREHHAGEVSVRRLG